MVVNYILIDTSYLIFYRFYALKKWWSIVNKDTPLVQQQDLHPEFYEKFKKVFLECIINIKKKLKLQKQLCRVVLALDCPREKIWRNQIFSDYKMQRVYEQQDCIGNIFKYVYSNNLLYMLNVDAIIEYNTLEADDIISIIKRDISLVNSEKQDHYKTWIITGDHDYLQLLDNNTSIINLAFKDLSEKRDVFKDANKNLFYKIILGDKSDNIKPVFSKCSKRQVDDYYNDRDKLYQDLENAGCLEQYKQNQQLIDFNYIPDSIVYKFKQANSDILVKLSTI